MTSDQIVISGKFSSLGRVPIRADLTCSSSDVGLIGRASGDAAGSVE